MLKRILNFINSILGLVGIKIVRATSDVFEMTSAIKRIVDHRLPVKSVIDIGASNGRWSKDGMRILRGASFVAIDPLKEREGALKALKKRCPRFDYVLCAAGDNDKDMITLNVSSDLDGSTVDGAGGESRKVPVRSIDGIVTEKKLEGPFLLKFDTHGYEIPILNGAKTTLDKTSIIIMEVYNFKITEHALRFHEMCIYMEKMGFRCFDLVGPMLRKYDGAFWQMDLFFCKTDAEIFSFNQYN